jgi:hypothetical protein
VKEYLFNSEKRHKLKLPLLPSAEGFNSAHPAQKQLDGVLDALLDSAHRPFWSIESRKVLTPEGVVCSCMTLDVFDRPVYLLVDDSYAQVHLQTPLLKGLKADQVASALMFLKGGNGDLAFKAVPQWTLAAHVDYPFDTFVAQADILLPAFRKEAREAALLVRRHLAVERYQQGYMEWAA